MANVYVKKGEDIITFQLNVGDIYFDANTRQVSKVYSALNAPELLLGDKLVKTKGIILVPYQPFLATDTAFIFDSGSSTFLDLLTTKKSFNMTTRAIPANAPKSIWDNFALVNPPTQLAPVNDETSTFDFTKVYPALAGVTFSDAAVLMFTDRWMYCTGDYKAGKSFPGGKGSLPLAVTKLGMPSFI